jgi:hypothetical protein
MSSYTSFSPSLVKSLIDINPLCLQYLRILSKSIVVQSHIEFLEHCINSNTIPKGFLLKFNPSVPFLESNHNMFTEIVSRCSTNLMNLVLSIYVKNLPTYVSRSITILATLSCILSSAAYLQLLNIQTTWTDSLQANLKSVKQSKISNLITSNFSSPYVPSTVGPLGEFVGGGKSPSATGVTNDVDETLNVLEGLYCDSPLNSFTIPKQPFLSPAPVELTTSENDTLNILENLCCDSIQNETSSLVSVPTQPSSFPSINRTRRGPNRKRGKRNKNKEEKPPYFEKQWGDEIPQNVMNLSSHNLTNNEKTILSLGLGFCRSSAHDPIRVLRDFRVFETKLRQKEFFSNPKNKDFIDAMKTKSSRKNGQTTNNKRVYTVRYRKSQEESKVSQKSDNIILETYLAKTKKRIRGLAFRKAHFRRNLTPQLESAIKSLKDNRNIRITKADKGRKTVLLNRNDYIKMGEEMFNDVSTYEKLNFDKEALISQIYAKYEGEIKEQLDLGNITIEDWTYLHHEDTDGIKLAIVYILPKIHKLSENQVNEKIIPKGRPIVSTTNAPYRKMDNLVASYMMPYINKEKIQDFIQDTPDLLRKIEEINDENQNDLPSSTKLQTQDVQSMYPSIDVDECVEAWIQIWTEEGTRIAPETLGLFLKYVLRNNYLEFNDGIWLQLKGLGMGQVCAPPASQGVMKVKTKQIEELSIARNIQQPSSLFRFMDDRFMTWLHSILDFQKYEEVCNMFGLTFTTDGPPANSKNFLDVTLFILNGRIETRIYRNPVSKSDLYLNYYSAHPSSTRNSIPYSLALRIVRNCSIISFQTEAFDELKNALILNSAYPIEIVEMALDRAKSRPREEILKPRVIENEDEMGRTVFVTPYHDSLLAIPHILREAADSLKGLDKTFDNIFERPPIVAWNRGPTLKQSIAPSKLHTGDKPCPGTKKCDRRTCSACKDVMEGRQVTIGNFTRKIIGSNTCDSKWVIYGLCCVPCDKWYVGKTFNSFKTRWSAHKSKINSAIRDRAQGGSMGSQGFNSELEGVHYLVEHFCEAHPNISSLKWTILHHVGKGNYDPAGDLLKWEHAYIDGLGTIWPKGLNCRS